MDPNDFSPSSPGKLVPTVEGAWAFVPGAIPRTIEWTGPLVRVLSNATTALGRLDGLGVQLPNPQLLIKPFLNREAVLSSRIEGTQAGLADVLQFDLFGETEREVPDAREVSNYAAAMHFGLKRLKSLPLSARLLRELHKKLMTGVRGQDQTPGEFRRGQNWIGPAGCKIADATFVPPPVPEMERALGEFEKALHEPSELPPLVQIAMLHYQFEAIHPFMDGNGRVGRLLIPLWLCAKELLSSPLLYLSAYFEAKREEYYQGLLEVSRRGRWSEWIAYFLGGVAEQADDARARAGVLLSLREDYHRRLRQPRISAKALHLIDELFRSPYLSVGIAGDLLGVTFPSAQKIVNKLVAAGILREITGRERKRIFVAEEILRAIE